MTFSKLARRFGRLKAQAHLTAKTMMIATLLAFGSANPVLAAGTNNAGFFYQLVPQQMVAGQTYMLQAMFTNNGSAAWAGSSGFGLQSTTDSTLGKISIPLFTGELTSPGIPRVFVFNFQAPATAGTYKLQLSMGQNGTAFGQAAPPLTVVVTKGATVTPVVTPPVTTTTTTPTKTTDTGSKTTSGTATTGTATAGATTTTPKPATGTTATAGTGTTATTGTGTTTTPVVTKTDPVVTAKPGKYAMGTDGQLFRDEAKADATFKKISALGMKAYRFDVPLADDTTGYIVSSVRAMFNKGISNHITMKPIIQVPFAWGNNRTDNGKYPAGDRDALYKQGFNRTYNFVLNFKNDIQDWELGNEINLLRLDANGSPLFGKGWTAAEYDTPLMNDWAAVLKGENDAIDKINKDYGLHLRKVLNTTSTMFGFLDFMKSKGVNFDVISYHYYETGATNPHNFWGGVRPNFDLFVKMASYGKPITINEVNCAEIYNVAFENREGAPLTEACFKSLHQILTYFDKQTAANIESVHIYELLDEPAKFGAEGRFGLMYDLSHPKVSALIAALHAGGSLTVAEKAALTKRGIE